jgi:hypothetical protein
MVTMENGGRLWKIVVRCSISGDNDWYQLREIGHFFRWVKVKNPEKPQMA